MKLFNSNSPIGAFLFCATLVSLTCSLCLTAPAEEDVLAALEEVKEEISDGNEYLLRYDLEAGEEIKFEIEQLVAIDTKIDKQEQKTRLKSRSKRTLRVERVAEDGNIVFSNIIDHVSMFKEVGGKETESWDSDSEDEPPAQYELIASLIGKPISEITINPQGYILERKDTVKQADIGLGGITIPMPDEAIKIGDSWSKPMNIRVRLSDNRIKEIKTRELYQLEKVETGVATISIKTQILTPINDPQVKAQLIQRISEGSIRFDLDAGRMLSKQLDWDEQVIGFNGAGSNMKYLARLTERVMTDAVARRPSE